MSEVRQAEVERVLRDATLWASARRDVAALALVGSWARGTASDESDVDLVLLIDEPTVYTRREDWVAELFPSAQVMRTGDWGAIVERRLLLASGLEVELGVASPSWAAVEPLDEGTRRVVGDGLRALYDPRGLLADLAAAVAASGSG